MTTRLRGVNAQAMTAEERLLEFTLLYRELLRAKQEHKMDSAAPAVGLAERPQTKIDRWVSTGSQVAVYCQSLVVCFFQLTLGRRGRGDWRYC